MDSNIQALVLTHGKDKVRALIQLRPLKVYMGLIAITSSSDSKVPVLCEIDETRYKGDEGYKIGWKPIHPYGHKPEIKMVSCNGFATESFYQSDFDDMVKDGSIKVYVEA